MAAASMVCNRNKSIRDTAGYLMQCPDRVSLWVERFREGGTGALREPSQ